MDKKLLGMEQARLESQIKEVGEQVRSLLHSNQARLQSQRHYHSPMDPGYDARQLAHLQQQGAPPPPQLQPQVPKPVQQSRIQAVELQQSDPASDAVSGLIPAPAAKLPDTAAEEGQSPLTPPPVAELRLAAQHRPAPQLDRRAKRGTTKTVASAAVDIPPGFDSHFFIRSVAGADAALCADPRLAAFLVSPYSCHQPQPEYRW